MKHIKSLFFSLLAFVIIAVGCKKDPETEETITYIKVGALLSITGDWNNLGISSNAALELGIAKINAYYTA